MGEERAKKKGEMGEEIERVVLEKKRKGGGEIKTTTA